MATVIKNRDRNEPGATAEFFGSPQMPRLDVIRTFLSAATALGAGTLIDVNESFIRNIRVFV
jgi:hypothetical protein